MKSNQKRSGIIRSLIAVLSFCLLTTIANGQSVFRGTFDLKESVRWGDKLLTAGTYSLTIDSLQVPVRAIVRSENGEEATIISTVNVQDAQEGGNSIRMTGNGRYRKVASLNLPQLGMSLVFAPKAVNESEMVAGIVGSGGGTGRGPVMSSRK
jgi:hypothetical protein